MCITRIAGLTLLALAAALPGAAAQAPPPAPPAALAGATPVLRSADGRRQIVATRAVTPVTVDGTLDDEVWRSATPSGEFIQSEPREGEPASEATEVFVAHDASTLYIAAYCHDTEMARAVVSEIRKDFVPENQDTFEVILDTFHDRRNGFMFSTNVEGARSDLQVANEGRETNASWDAVWIVRTRRIADGWTLEMAIPFRSLRFERGDGHVWGVNFSRRIRRKNEVVYWSPVPRAFNIGRVSEGGDMAGLPMLNPGRNLRIKPYVLGSSVREVRTPAFERNAEIGLDVKYGVTPSLTLDVTLNPDFAQAEADEQQVNLTQFSQFFPEKREFFLENSGIFYVGDAQRSNRRNPTPTPDEDMLLFFSRRIGLTPDGRAVPIFGGARVTGNVGGVGIGAMSIQTRGFQGTPATNYTMVRGRKNMFGNSDVGAFLMSRQAAGRADDYNRVYGVDATLRLPGGVDWSSYVVNSAAPGTAGSTHAWRTTVLWQAREGQIRSGLMEIGDGFVSDLSYYRRVGMRKYFLETGYRPRPEALQRLGVREVHSHINWDYQTDLHGSPVAKKLHQGVSIPMNNGAWIEPSFDVMFQQLTRPLRLSTRAPHIQPGGYGWRQYQFRFNSDPSRRLSVAFLPTWGGLWNGTQKTANVTATVRPSYRLSAALAWQVTDADLPGARFTKTLTTLRTNYSFSTNMYLDSLLQYDNDLRQFNANVRFNFIHRPLSDLFVVYNEQRFTTTTDPIAPGRGVIVKFTRMLSF